MGGTILYSSYKGSLDAKNIVIGVLTKALDLAHLSQLCVPCEVPELTATIPMQEVGAASGFDLSEWESSNIESGKFDYVNFDLKKDRVRLAVSDEARYKSKAGDPMALQKEAAAQRLAYLLDQRVIQALQTSPQTSAATAKWDTPTNNPLKDLAIAAAAMRPFVPNYVIMPSAVWAAFVANDYTSRFAQGNPGVLKGAVTRIPGLELDVYVTDNSITAKSVTVGCSNAPCAAFGQGPVKVREEDVMDGGEIWQIDTWRQVVSPIMKTAGGLNMGAYQLTGVIA